MTARVLNLGWGMTVHVPKRILIPVDFSPQSRRALEYGFVLARQFNAEVHVLHAWRPTPMPPIYWGQIPDLDRFERSRAGESMKEYLSALEDGGIEVLGRIENGSPEEAILRVATDGEFDLIVMGTHGRTGISRLLHRHVAERVVRSAPCPVVTIRVPDDELAVELETIQPVSEPEDIARA